MPAASIGTCAFPGCDRHRAKSRSRCREHEKDAEAATGKSVDWATWDVSNEASAILVSVARAGPGRAHGHLVALVTYGPDRQTVCSCGEVVSGQRTDEAMSRAFGQHRREAPREGDQPEVDAGKRWRKFALAGTPLPDHPRSPRATKRRWRLARQRTRPPPARPERPRWLRTARPSSN